MVTNDIKKGMRVKLENGWEGEMKDNAKGNRRMVLVFGFYTEIGSVYSHDIVAVQRTPVSEWEEVEHTKEQNKLRDMVNGLFGELQ